MSDSENDLDTTDETLPDELTLLKQRATLLGITFSNKIGVDALRARIQAKLDDSVPDDGEDDPDDEEPAVVPVAAARLTKAERIAAQRREIRDEEMKMVRIRITNLNPNKKELSGEIFTVANKFLGIVKKFIPYGEATEDGYHVPHIIYKQLKDRKFLNIKTRRNRTTGQIEVEQNWAPEFALEVLPQLTRDELARLAAAQAAAGGVS